MFIGAILLIAGCCIGAGMLGTPIVACCSGFIPSSLVFILCWLFMFTTGLLELEVVLWYKKRVNLLTIAEKTLGKVGRGIVWFFFAFVFYALMVAYIGGTGQLIADFSQDTLPEWAGSLGVALLFGALLLLGIHTVDRFNRLLMCGLFLTYIGLILLGIFDISPSYLLYRDWSYVSYAIPPMILSFGYHNLIPTISHYLDDDPKLTRQAIFLGSFLPLLFYLLWQLLILGLIPLAGMGDGGDLVTRALRGAIGASWVAGLAEMFAFFALVTSLLSVALSFTDFLSDGFSMEKKGKNRLFLVALSLGPPLFFAWIYPKIFILALRYAGAFGAVVLFGIMPALMVWKGRYSLGMQGNRFVRGGRLSLALVLMISISIILLECFVQWNAL